jgi:hypothetical protein
LCLCGSCGESHNVVASRSRKFDRTAGYSNSYGQLKNYGLARSENLCSPSPFSNWQCLFFICGFNNYTTWFAHHSVFYVSLVHYICFIEILDLNYFYCLGIWMKGFGLTGSYMCMLVYNFIYILYSKIVAISPL